MRVGEAAEVLLVRAVEETAPERVSDTARAAAVAAAGELDHEDAWLARRARALLDGDLARFRPLEPLPEALARSARVAFVVAVPLGALANTLGPGGRIHVLYNPLALLVAWNVAMIAVLLLRRSLRRRVAPGSGRLVRAVWVRAQRLGAGSAGEAREVAAVASAFFERATSLFGRAFELCVSRTLHAGALGLVLGAVAGMFVRGVFLEYDVIWRSTFVRDPETVARVLATLLGPAALLLGEPLPSVDDARALLSEAGLPAARWLGLHALTAALFAMLPRALLFGIASARLRRLERSVALDTSEPYFRERLDEPRRRRVSRVEASIGEDVRAACAALAAELADFACERLYDARVVPALEAFRRDGGKLADLEAALARECAGFQAELDMRVPRAIEALEAQLARDLARRVGAVRLPEPIVASRVGERLVGETGDAARLAGEKVGVRVSDGVGVVVSGAVAAAAGTLAGGFGKTLGVAVVTTLLGTTGPIGFLVGALGGLALAGAGWRVARASVARRMRDLPLPPFVVRTLLWRGRFERLLREGRARTRESVRSALAAELDVLAPRLAERIGGELGVRAQ